MKATCKKDKVEILEYCKKVYPERDITNIVESSHYVKVNNWCKLGQKKCRSGSQQWVKPYRCLGRWRYSIFLAIICMQVKTLNRSTSTHITSKIYFLSLDRK